MKWSKGMERTPFGGEREMEGGREGIEWGTGLFLTRTILMSSSWLMALRQAVSAGMLSNTMV